MIRLAFFDSVRGKVISGMIILILILLGGVLTLLGFSQVRELAETALNRTDEIVTGTVQRVAELLATGEDAVSIRRELNDLENLKMAYFVAVLDSSGRRVHYTLNDDLMAHVLDRTEAIEAINSRSATTFHMSDTSRREMRIFVKPIIDFDTYLGTLLAGFLEEDIGRSENRRRQGIVLLGLMGIFIGSLFAALLAKNILSPIERLRSAAQRIGEGQFGETVEIETTDEIGALAETFNTMSLELRKREVEVRRAERLSAIGTTASAIAHEMKTPITSIKTYVDMLPMRFEDPEFRGKFSHTIEDQTTRLIKLIDDLLDYSRETRLHLSDLDLNLQLHLAVGVFRDLMVSNRITVLENYQSKRTTKGDPDKLEQVFFNLIKNGIEAQGEGGAIAILTLDDGPSVLTVVADAGAGVDPSTKESLFEPFVTTKSKGTGLGLAIARKVVAAHGGEIELCSPLEEIDTDLLEQVRVTLGDHWPGIRQGSCFMVRLPAVTESEN
ncbi:ATP-binding protein [Gemmatimonadota bacterium]